MLISHVRRCELPPKPHKSYGDSPPPLMEGPLMGSPGSCVKFFPSESLGLDPCALLIITYSLLVLQFEWTWNHLPSRPSIFLGGMLGND